MNNFSGVEIAVIGMSGEFPGAKDLDAFWDNLENGRESVTFFSDEKLAEAGIPLEEYSDPNYVKANSFIEGKQYFDADFFGYRPAEAELMDPQIRIFHEHCWKALEDAGINIQKNEDKIGLFAGGSFSQNWVAQALFSNEEGEMDNFSASLFFNISYLCSRVAHALNLQGPTMFMNTACSTSLVAIQRAAMSLLLRECKVAMAGGVSLLHMSVKGYPYKEGMVNSKDGHCRSYDETAMGTIHAEGVGVVVLKRLKDAIADGDQIHAIIRGSGINNDGDAKMSFTAPSQKGQYKAIAKAYQMAKVDPKTISMIEGHGSGTPLGDPIEVEALQEVFKDSSHPCALGSVKTNIGHADAAAGVAGFIKTVLSLRNKAIPASLNFKKANAKINFEKGPFFVNTKLKAWDKTGIPRRAGVSSFGMGGTNVHLVLEEAPEVAPDLKSKPGRQVLKFSARSEASLKSNIQNLRHFLEDNQEVNLMDLAYTLNTGRADLPFRKSLVFEGRRELISGLDSARLTKNVKAIDEHRHIPTVFMFAGQGAEYVGMFNQLYSQHKVFREALDKCLVLVSNHKGIDVKSLLLTDAVTSQIHQTEFTQPVLFSIQYALVQTLKFYSVEADQLIGHSLGEYVAACLAGAFTLEEGIRLMVARGELMQQASEGAMMAVSITETDLLPLLIETKGVTIGTTNSTELQVVSGSKESIESLRTKLDERKVSCKLMPEAAAYHSSWMKATAEEFRKTLDQINFKPLTIPLVSNLDGKVLQAGSLLDSDYWAAHMVQTVRFKEGISTIFQNGPANFLEIGPGIELSVFVKSNQDRQRTHKVTTLTKHQDHESDDQFHLLSALGKLWEVGVDLDWQQLFADPNPRKISLPTYAFQRRQFTAEADAQALLKARLREKSNGLEVVNDLDKCLYAPAWETADTNAFEEASYAYHVFFSDGSTTCDAIRADLLVSADQLIEVKIGEEFSHSGDQFILDPKQPSHFRSLFQELRAANMLLVFGWGLHPGSGRLDEALFNEELDRSCYPLIHISRCVDEFFADHHVKIKTLSFGLHQVFPVDPLLPEKTPLLAAVRLINKEFPNLTVQNIDLPEAGLVEESQLLQEIKGESEDLTVAFRFGSRMVQRMKPVQVPNAEKLTIESGDVILITGGAGGMGLNFQRQLANRGVTFIITGRSELPPKSEWENLANSNHDKAQVIASLLANEAQGSKVAYYQVDVSNESEMAHVIRDAEAAFGKITGVIHAAGGVDFGGVLQQRKTIDDTIIWEPKVYGAITLQSLFTDYPLKFMVLCASNASIGAPEGEFAYVAANLFLNALSKKYHGARKTISINWNHVREVGMAHEAAKALAARGIHTVIDSISAQEAGKLLERSISLGMPELILSRFRISQVYETVAEKVSIVEGEVAEEVFEDADAMQGALTGLWVDFFGKQVAPEDDFFDLGGDSLKAITLIGRINQNFRVNITIKEFLNHPNVELLNGLIQEKKETGEQGYTSIPKAGDKSSYVLTPVQHRLYFVHQLDKNSLAYNTPKVIRLEGKLDEERLIESVAALEARHNSLRATFTLAGKEPVQKINALGFLKAEFEALERGVTIQDKVKTLVKPFDLENGPTVRIVVLRAGPEDHYLFLDMHHIITDGTSHNLIVRDFLHFYKELELPELSIQYEDYAEWLHETTQVQSLAKQKQFWLEQYREEPVMLDIPTDFPRSEERSFKGDAYEFPMSKAETSRLKRMAENKGVTPYVLMLSVYKLFLSKLCNQEDIIIGSPTAGRRYPELENLIGMFINTLPIRSLVRPNLTFDAFLKETQQLVISCFDNQDVPLDELIDELKLERETGRNPLFDVEFVYKNFEDEAFEIEGLKYTSIELEQNTAFDILLSVYETNDQLYFRWEYTKELFTESTVAQFSTYFINLMNQVFEDMTRTLSQYHYLDEATRTELLALSKGPKLEVPAEQLITTFERVVEQNPDQIAIRFDNTTWTYQALNEKANGLAELISSRSTASGRVALLFPPGQEMIISMLGVQKAGRAYIPLSPETPKERNRSMIQDSQAELLLAHPDYVTAIESSVEVLEISEDKLETCSSNPIRKDDPEQTVYIIYTSGTTGQPKGVEVSHRGVSNFIHWRIQQYGFDTSHNTLQLLSYHFDGFASNMYAALLSGGILTLVRNEHRLDTRALLQQANLNSITNMVITPGIYGALLAGWEVDLAKEAALQFVILAGEAATPILIEESKRKFPRVAIHNEYGPTETSIGATFLQNMDDISVTNIGKPVANTRAYILGSHGELLPKGAKGELCIGGSGLALGYLGQEVLTAEKFLVYDSIGERVYKTGDLARYLPDGNIEFLGRVDSQIKIRGFRVELGEISKQILRLTEVKEVFLDVFTREGEKFIAAYCVADKEQQVRNVKAKLEEQLPPYMVPSQYAFIQEVPLTVTGKVDLPAIKETPYLKEVKVERTTGSVSVLEQQIAEIWKDVLKIDEVNVQDRFFDIGGTSLSVIKLKPRIEEIVGKEIDIYSLFKYPTIEKFVSSVFPEERAAGKKEINMDSLQQGKANKLRRLSKKL